MNAADSRKCAHCGKSFTPRRSDARYCSNICRWAGNRANRAVRTDTVRITPRTGAPTDMPGLLTWEPPSDAPGPFPVSETCLSCEQPVWTTGRGTRRACFTCNCGVIPEGVRAPYERGSAAGRQVKSQRERDLEAVALARRKGIMLDQLDQLDQLGQLAGDGRLHPESRPVVEWFADQVKTANGQARLEELAVLLPEAGIRRHHWWQSSPATLDAARFGDDHEDQDDEDDWGAGNTEGQGVHDPSLPPNGKLSSGISAINPTTVDDAAEPAGRPMTWADALALLGWRLVPLSEGCEISQGGPTCGAAAARHISDGWVCYQHYEALAIVITRSRRK